MEPFLKGRIIPIEGGNGSVEFQYNPDQIKGPHAKAGWDKVKVAGREQPLLQYSCGETTEIAFTVKASFSGGSFSEVEDLVESMRELLKPTVKGAGVDRPPRLKLILAGFKKRWTCVLADMDPLFAKIFQPITGAPFYAEITLTFWEYLDE